MSDNAKILQQTTAQSVVETNRAMGDIFRNLQPISLARTNELAKMQSRIDNKYLVNLEEFRNFLKSIQAEYSVLEIKGRRQFTYHSCYYDDEFRCYFEHHQGRRQRLKVRTRKLQALYTRCSKRR